MCSWFAGISYLWTFIMLRKINLFMLNNLLRQLKMITDGHHVLYAVQNIFKYNFFFLSFLDDRKYHCIKIYRLYARIYQCYFIHSLYQWLQNQYLQISAIDCWQYSVIIKKPAVCFMREVVGFVCFKFWSAGCDSCTAVVTVSGKWDGVCSMEHRPGRTPKHQWLAGRTSGLLAFQSTVHHFFCEC